MKFYFDENATFLYNLYDKQGQKSVNGKFVDCGDGANDAPCAGEKFLRRNTPRQAWSYALPAGITVTPGVVLITGEKEEKNSDALIFKNNVIYVFSAVSPDEAINKRESDGSALPNADNVSEISYKNPDRTLEEDVRDDANSGVVYQPRKGDPGSVKNQDVVYGFASDGNGGKDVDPIRKDMASTDPAKSKGDSVYYDSANQQIRFSDDRITETLFIDDNIVGAAINEPSLTLVRRNSDGTVTFRSNIGGIFTITKGADVFMSARLDSLTYNQSDNTFTGELSDLSFDIASGSPWVSETADVFDPRSADFLPDRKLIFSYTPDSNFAALTRSFSVSGTSSGTDGIGASIPEPPTFFLTFAGLLLMVVYQSCSLRKERSRLGRRMIATECASS